VTGVVFVMVLAGCGSSGSAGADGGNGLPVATGGSPSVPGSAGRIAVVAGENFWGNITEQIGGDRVAVTSIITDPNADPHEYESSVDNASAIAHADLVVENGVGYDDFLAKLLAVSPSSTRTVLEVSKLVGVTGSNPNPHLWYDPEYVVAAAKAIETRLSAEDPSSAGMFATNLASFLAGEQRVVAVIDEIRAKYTGTAIAYTERVPGYLIQAAGLHLGTPASFSQSIEDGNDPSPMDNAEFEKALSDHTVKVLLYNSQVTDTETAHLRRLAIKDHVPVVGVSETMPLTAKNFQTWQADQAKALLAALNEGE
jgi:zinc/manganese transport system substrate-binding protein